MSDPPELTGATGQASPDCPGLRLPPSGSAWVTPTPPPAGTDSNYNHPTSHLSPLTSHQELSLSLTHWPDKQSRWITADILERKNRKKDEYRTQVNI